MSIHFSGVIMGHMDTRGSWEAQKFTPPLSKSPNERLQKQKGATENAGPENGGPSKMQGWKMQDWQIKDQMEKKVNAVD